MAIQFHQPGAIIQFLEGPFLDLGTVVTFWIDLLGISICSFLGAAQYSNSPIVSFLWISFAGHPGYMLGGSFSTLYGRVYHQGYIH